MNRARTLSTVRPEASRRRPPLSTVAAASLPLVALLSAPAHAYVGPGAGLGVLGTLFGIGAAIVLAVFGLFWYPLKRAFGRKSVAGGADAAGGAAASGIPGAERRDVPPETGTDASIETDAGSSAAARRDGGEPR